MPNSRMKTKTLQSWFILFLRYQIEDPKWRLSNSQAKEIQEVKNILHARGLKKK